MEMIEKRIPLRKEFTSGHILAFTTMSLIKMTIKALIIPFCQLAVEIIFITDTSFISDCVSVMIIRVVTPWSCSKSILWAFREALIEESGPVQFSSDRSLYFALIKKIVSMTGLNGCNRFPFVFLVVLFVNVQYAYKITTF